MVPADHSVWRTVRDDENWLIWSEELQRPLLRIRGPGVNFDPDLSTTWKEHMEDIHGLAAAFLIELPPGRSLVYEARVEDLLGLGLEHSHTPTNPKPPGCAHLFFFRPSTVTTKPEKYRLELDIAMRMTLVSGIIHSMSRPPGA